MEAIITVVGFLGAGKTTLLKHLTTSYLSNGWSPFIILNDYENAYLDSQQFIDQMDSKWVRSLNGSCICCSGIGELRDFVNSIPERENGVTLIEANGTSDACSLMGFLGVGIIDRFLPPIQISVVDVNNWQRREEHNELEANQVQVSSLIVLAHLENVSEEREQQVIKDIMRFNSSAQIIKMDEIDVSLLPKLPPSRNEAEKFDHMKAHWSSASVDLNGLTDHESIKRICASLPSSILRVKGCTRIGTEEDYTYFERTPSGEVYIRSYFGIPITGPKLVCIGPGSSPSVLQSAIDSSIPEQTA